jgi:hypothetical protein
MRTGSHGSDRDVSVVLSHSAWDRILPPHLEPVPQLNEVYELEIAFYESQILSDEELLRNGAYFARVGDRLTRHFLMCSGDPVRLPEHSSSRLKSFFQTNQFKTGYATHGLFPYRGKFHPQMIKGLMNVMGLKPGETVLDPMMGSGTVLIEATLMGIRSIGLDASPFCAFMTRSKLSGLTVPIPPIRLALRESKSVFEYFKALAGQPTQGKKIRSEYSRFGSSAIGEDAPSYAPLAASPLPKELDGTGVYDFLLLAYLDSAGYAERSERKPPFEQFRAILERYVFVAEKVQMVLEGTESELAETQALEGDARLMPIEADTIDGIVFSPPYSFAIDYLDNDSFHLGFLGTDINRLREQMVGLRGTTFRRKYELYVEDMERVLRECSRVLRVGRYCTIVVGTNNNQLSKITGRPPESVKGIDQILIEIGLKYNLDLVRKLSRQITGMSNTMRTEYILILQRT